MVYCKRNQRKEEHGLTDRMLHDVDDLIFQDEEAATCSQR